MHAFERIRGSVARSGVFAAADNLTLTCYVFLRLLGLVNLIAFVSLWVQVDGLVGSHGITPAADWLDAVDRALGGHAWLQLPTLCWLGCSDAMLHGLCAAGTLASLLLLLDVCPAAMLAIAWICYLSLCGVGQDFLAFQWDILLTEVDFLCIFLAPLTLLPRRPADAPAPSMVVVWLLRLLLFRLMFESGLVKLESHDPTWRGLTALEYHFYTQPLPTPLAWYAQHLWPSLLHASTAIMFVIELGVPWLVFAPRRARLAAFFPLVGFQMLIAATGNYGFFNLLTAVLCVGALLDDDSLPRWLQRFRDGTSSAARWPAAVVVPVAALLLFLSVPVASPVSKTLEGLRLVNHYGLFAAMTTQRQEIVIEGSLDGSSWLAYEFRYKPGDPSRAPPWVAPYMPRLDWQMWFAALSDARDNPWFIRTCQQLLEANPQVLSLLARDPFDGRRPMFLRARLYDYHFTAPNASNWWERVPAGEYLPVISLKDFRSRD